MENSVLNARAAAVRSAARNPGPATRMLRCAAAVAVGAALAGAAQAQWVWRDASGAVTYSDTPPPADVRPADIVRQPVLAPPPDGRSGATDAGASSYGSAGNGAAPASEPAAPGTVRNREEPARPPAAARTLADQEADFRKRQADREKAQQKSAQEESQAAARAEACNQAKGYLQMIEDGTRLMRPDAEGNRNFLEGDQRAAETQKAQDAIAKNC